MNEQKKLYEIVQGFEKWNLRLISPKDASDVYLKEVPSNPWKSFSQEKPEEGEYIHHAWKPTGESWYSSKVQYDPSLPIFKDEDYWMAWIPPLVEEEKDECEKAFKEFIEKEFPQLEQDSWTWCDENLKVIFKAGAAWQAALKSKEKV